MRRVTLLGVVVVVAAAACGGASPRPYSADHTFTCLRHRPETHTASPAAPGLHYAEVAVVHGRRGNGVWAGKDPHVPTLYMRFAPFRRRSSQESDSFAFANASFFTDRKAESAYFHAAYHNAQEGTHFLNDGLLVQQRRNVVIEWNSPFNHDYLRVVLGCLTP
jgi:hypothetical protein